LVSIATFPPVANLSEKKNVRTQGPKKPKVGDKLGVPTRYELMMPVSNTNSLANTPCPSPTLGSIEHQSAYYLIYSLSHKKISLSMLIINNILAKIR